MGSEQRDRPRKKVLFVPNSRTSVQLGPGGERTEKVVTYEGNWILETQTTDFTGRDPKRYGVVSNNRNQALVSIGQDEGLEIGDEVVITTRKIWESETGIVYGPSAVKRFSH